jgi:hypothetical protein
LIGTVEEVAEKTNGRSFRSPTVFAGLKACPDPALRDEGNLLLLSTLRVTSRSFAFAQDDRINAFFSNL